MTNLMVMHSATVTICSCTRTGTRRVQVREQVLTFQVRVHIPDCVVNLSTQCLVECYHVHELAPVERNDDDNVALGWSEL